MKPQEPIPHNYSMQTLNKIFAISSIALLMVTGAMVGYDYIRGWKKFQFEFLRMQRQRIEQEIKTASDAQTADRLRELDKQVKVSQREIAKNREQYRASQAEAERWEGKHYAADQDFRFAKATLDAARYETELAITQKARDAGARRRDYAERSAHVDQLQIRLQEVTRSRDAARARADVWVKKVKDLEDQRSETTAAIDRLNKQLTTVSANSHFFILNAPMLDFINPTFKVDQVVLKDMFVDMNYMGVPRVDRCTTCHRAIDRQGFESKKEAARMQGELESKLDAFKIQPQQVEDTRARIEQLKKIQAGPRDILNPYRTHPKLDTFVGSASPHPMSDYGCTACHRGSDRATEFGRAGHTPMSRKQERRWSKGWDYDKRNWGYKVNPFLDTPMYPRQNLQAGCVKCHAGQVSINQGEEITRGTRMVELYGCHACHKISNWRFSNLRKPGPDLTGIAEKTTPQWAIRWIAEPHEFRSTTRMPSFFYQRNMVDPHVVERREREGNIKKQDAEVHAITSYLFDKSTRRKWIGGMGGDAQRGASLVESVGCLGCHVTTESFTEEGGKVRKAKRDDFPLERNYGFNLTGTGTKSNPDWLFNWLKNPKGYYHDAPMPDLRLTDQEAADITAYLMTLQKRDFMQRPVRNVDRAALRELSKSYLINTLTDKDAEARLKSMSDNDQLVYLGQRTIEKYGCYSCHTIKGFDGLKPIGTELTIEGSKNLHLFDFGFAHDYKAHDGKKEHILHTVPSWIYTKTRSPRVWDDKREKNYHDKLKMPNFHLSVDEANSITSVVLGLTKEKVDSAKLAGSDSRSRIIEEGRKSISQHNCRACHVLDGYGRAIAQTISDPGMLPPDLTPQGERVQSEWLFNFLKDPTVMTMRPWLSVRMPTFHFSDQETNTLVTHFAAAGNVSQFDTTRNLVPDARSVAVGQQIFNMLRCIQCHPTGPAAATASADAASLAPALNLARVRLRHDWIPDWVRRPNEIIPGTKMPTNFPRDPKDGHFISPLADAINSPAFAAQKSGLLPYFRDEAELTKTMSDAVALTNYLRDYIWTLGPSQMRTASPAPEGLKTIVPTDRGSPSIGKARGTPEVKVERAGR
ncbi:MAG TPA: hypothetical protein VNM92_16055 [Thermoanaerobaculia bacterium]|nr:hypothetical protein [Thermoanaerobaculia bacterium]